MTEFESGIVLPFTQKCSKMYLNIKAKTGDLHFLTFIQRAQQHNLSSEFYEIIEECCPGRRGARSTTFFILLAIRVVKKIPGINFLLSEFRRKNI